MGGVSQVFRNWGLAKKMALLFCLFGLVPMAVVGYLGASAVGDMEDAAGARFQGVAENIADKIDRSLFERYGDVQVFASNRIVGEKYNWYSTERNEIADAMDQYVATYGIYYLTIFVDPVGDVIAVNGKDAQGEPLDTAALYTKNYADAPWLMALLSEEYTTTQPFATPGNDRATGTFIEDLHVDEDVKAVYPGEDGLVIGFSAPVYVEGDLIGYWSNRTKFSLVEEMVQSAYQELKGSGFPNAEITILGDKGQVFVDYDPSTQGTGDITHDLENVLFKLNLAEKGVEAAREAVVGKTGYDQSEHARKNIRQLTGYTHLKGALGFPGMNWSVLVRSPIEEALAEAISFNRNLMLTAMGCLALILPMGLWIGRKGASQIKILQEGAAKMASGDYGSRVVIAAGDEIGQLGEAFNHMAEEIQTKNIDMARASSMMMNAPANLMCADLDLNILYMNPASIKTLKSIEQHLPISVDTMMGQSIDVFHKNPEHQRRILRDPDNLPHQARIQIGPETLDLLVSPVFDANNNYLGPMLTWDLITEKLATEVKLKEANERVKHQAAEFEGKLAAIDKAQAVIEFNLDGTILTANDNFLTTVGYDLVEVQGKHHRMFCEPAYAASPEYQAFWAKLNRGEYESGVYLRIGKGGKEVWIQASYNPIMDANGQPFKVVKFATDITAQKNQDLKLQEGVTQIAEIGNSLAGAAEELNSVSSQMSSMADDTSNQANVVSAAAEQVSKNVQTVSTGSEEMTASIQEIAKNTTDAARVAAQAVSVAESTNATIGKLGQSSAEIGSIIKVITTIAEQTNLLALNATIEAARAGDAGKGFAVVANEVKELAKETTKATENISRMIETIQEDTKGSVDAIEEISTIITQVNDYMNTIASAVEEQTVTTNEMARNVTEASRGSLEIAGNIVSVADGARGTTEGAMQTQQASAELAKMATDLQKVVTGLT